jgi:hypothetical protein
MSWNSGDHCNSAGCTTVATRWTRRVFLTAFIWRGLDSLRYIHGAFTEVVEQWTASIEMVATNGIAAPGSAHAQQPFTVSASASAPSYPVGADAAVVVRIEGNTASLPSFDYTVQGGTLEGVLPATPVAANVAQGTVFVTRADAGLARVTISFGGQELAAADIRFVGTGSIEIRATLDAGINAAARTWRYEVVNSAGAVVSTLNISTSGDAPTGAATVPNLPHGSYTVRQLLGSDTGASCAANLFYEVTTAATTVQLAGPSATASFTIRPCPALPNDLEVLIPVDTIAPGFGPGVIGDAAPGEEPFSEVAGARQPGFIPLPPNTGNSALAAGASGSPVLLIALALVVLVLPFLGWSVREWASQRQR